MKVSIDDNWKAIHYTEGVFQAFEDTVATEMPLTCVVNGERNS